MASVQSQLWHGAPVRNDKLREIRAQKESYDGVCGQDAEWMVEHWPGLKVGLDGHLEEVFELQAREGFKARCVLTLETKASVEI